MIRNFEELQIDQIAWSDTRFRLTFRRVPDLLAFSVREMGVLNPLIVSESERAGRFCIVTGWLRFEAARLAGEISVPCHVYRNIPPKLLLLCAIFDNLGQRQMNPIERALAMERLGEFYSLEEIRKRFLPLLGGSGDDPARLRALLKLPEEIRWAVADGELQEATAQILGVLPGAHGRRVWHLVRGLRMGPRMQREVVEHFFALWERNDIPPGAVIEEEGWKKYEQLAVTTPTGTREAQSAKRDRSKRPNVLVRQAIAGDAAVVEFRDYACGEKGDPRRESSERERALADAACRVCEQLRARRLPHLAKMQPAGAEGKKTKRTSRTKTT